ncbi:hypothetical protein [Candidatus Enterovibrio escicola]|uniref:Uncharacterized protein n=1 Tax=Candidatus Enterovibrio escicola TaxID=1927127 RepID=A0A2A5T1H9_9GAMM|nr:hypothetical protein [Candidatus Enterovibrio escacola]PCS21980.1 hypothetical protein BTN49_2445 [Candidatus Enterovibrio escacola]
MSQDLSRLDTIDKHLLAVLTASIMDVDEISRLLNERRQCLEEIKMLPKPPEGNAWSSALRRTKRIVNLMEIYRNTVAVQARPFIKGRKLVQTYKKFE